MSSDISVRVLGAERLAATLRKAGADVVDMKDASQRVGAIVAATAQSMAPSRTGRLAKSIRPARRARGVFVRTGSYRYAWVQEYGSATKHIAPRAYMRGALAAKQREAVDQYERELNTIMQKVTGEK